MINHTVTVYDNKDNKRIDKCKMVASVHNKYTDAVIDVYANVEDMRQLYWGLKQYFEGEKK